MGLVGDFKFNDGLDPILNPQNFIRNEDYVLNLERLTSLLKKVSPVAKITQEALSGSLSINVDEAYFFKSGQKITILTPTSVVYNTTVTLNPTDPNLLNIQPINVTIPINSVITLTSADVIGVLGTFTSLSSKLQSIQDQASSDLLIHKNSTNAHSASNIPTTGTGGVNVQAQLEYLKTNKLDQTQLTVINQSITEADNVVTQNFQNADNVVTQNFQNADNEIFRKINLFTQASSYIQRNSSGLPFYPNISSTVSSSVTKYLISDEAYLYLSNFPQPYFGNSLVLATNILGKNYVYSLGGDTNSIVGINYVTRAEINSNGTLSSWVQQTNLPANSISLNSGLFIENGSDKRIVFAAGVAGKLYVSNNMSSNGNITSWTTGATFPTSSTSFPSCVTIKIGSDYYLYMLLGNNTNTLYWKKWNFSTNNIDDNNWNTQILDINTSGRYTLTQYGQGFYVSGGFEKDLFYIKVNNNGKPFLTRLQQKFDIETGYHQNSIITIDSKDYLVISGGFLSNTLTTANYINSVNYYQIIKDSKELKFVTTIKSPIPSVTGLTNSFTYVSNNKYIHYQFILNGSTTQVFTKNLTKDVSVFPVNITVSGGEYVINNNLLDNYLAQNFNNLLFSDSHLDGTDIYYLFVSYESSIKSFKLTQNNTISNNTNLLVAKILVNNVLGTITTNLFDSSVIQDLLNSNNHTKNSILEGCDLSHTLPLTLNISDGLFDFSGKILGTTAQQLSLSSFSNYEIDNLGPVELEYSSDLNESRTSLTVVHFTNGNSWIYKIGGFTGSYTSNVQKAMLNEDGCITESFSTNNCSPISVTPGGTCASLPLVMDNGDRKILVFVGGTNQILLSSAIHSSTGAILSWTTLTTFPETLNYPKVRTCTLSNTLYLYILNSGTGNVFSVNVNTSTQTLGTIVNRSNPVSTSFASLELFNNEHIYVIGGGSSKIYRGSIQSDSSIVWNNQSLIDIPVIDNLVNANTSLVTIQGEKYLYITGGNQTSNNNTTGFIKHIYRTKVLANGVPDLNWDILPLGFETYSDDNNSCVCVKNNNIIIYQSIGYNGSHVSYSDRLNMIPVYTKQKIGYSLPYFNRSSSGIVSVALTKDYNSIQFSTLLGLMKSNGVHILSSVSIAKQRKYESAWTKINGTSTNFIHLHNLIYPIKNYKVRLKVPDFGWELDLTNSVHQTTGYGNILHFNTILKLTQIFTNSFLTTDLPEVGAKTMTTIANGIFKIIVEG